MELTGPSENSSCLLSELHNYFPQTCGWTSTCYAHEIQFMQMLLEGLIIKRRWPPELEEKYSFNQIPLFNRRFYGDNGSERQEHSSTSTLLKKGHASIPALFPLIACGLKTITDIQTHTYENGHTQTHTETHAPSTFYFCTHFILLFCLHSTGHLLLQCYAVRKNKTPTSS